MFDWIRAKSSHQQEIKLNSSSVKVYNFEVKYNHNYFASPLRILVHNKNIDVIEVDIEDTENK